MPRRTDISSTLIIGARLIAPILLALVAISVSACAHSQRLDLRQEFEEVRTNCGLPRMLMTPADDNPRVLLFRFPQRHDAYGAAERNGSWACLTHWARERGVTLRPTSHHELPGE